MKTSNLILNNIFGDNNVFDHITNISSFFEVAQYTFMRIVEPGTSKENYFVYRDPSTHEPDEILPYNIWCYEFDRSIESYHIKYCSQDSGGGIITLCLVDQNYTLIRVLHIKDNVTPLEYDDIVDISSNQNIKYLLFNLSKYEYNWPVIDALNFSEVAQHTFMLDKPIGTTRSNYFSYREPTESDPVLNYNVWSYEFNRTSSSRYQINYTETNGSGITTLCLVDQNYTLIQKLIIMAGSPVTFNDIVDISSNQNITYLLFNLNKLDYNWPTVNIL